MKEFNLEEAKTGKPICTLDGYPVIILAWNIKGDHPLVGYVEYPKENKIEACAWTETGKIYDDNEECNNDIVMKSTKYKGWLPLYRIKDEEENTFMNVVGGKIYNNKDDAIFYEHNNSNFIGVYPIKWEEDDKDYDF